MKKLLKCLFSLTVFLLAIGGQVALADESPQVSEENHLIFTGEKQLLLGDLDHLGRATFAHIQLQDKHEPKYGREPRISHNPVGWRNYEFYYGDGKKKAWLMNRGHLVGYQFSGLNNEARNLVPLTAWLNAGDYSGSNPLNSDSMLYYEQKLDKWLADNPDKWLDYRVTAHYEGDELIPRTVELQYVGMDRSGKLETINIGGREDVDVDGMVHVVLDNISLNATIDYATGNATNEVASARVQEEQAAYASQDVHNVDEESRIVYVARQGRAEVYWHDKSNMPSNTNWDNVIEMTEAEAKSQGKRHTSKE